MVYQRGTVSVDVHFARFGSKSYAIDKINSVDVRVEHKSGCLWIALLFLTILFALAAMGAAVSSEGDSTASWGITAILAVITVLAYRSRPKPTYHLMLATSSGEVQATKSQDDEAIYELRTAIEAAMMEGR
ncbi:DUF6232 family protein [Novosphingobium pentaromativorans]|uniref:Uncharacterized protein n=1 Tax=Novosphingobium pentaromativorans US6-1 TaxID=1088721 RepID=G6EFH0_9SPHN|nr:DUF6232 family protein [Novosphingobium pentaromativorans]AIT79119.1 hypothetical protein JI59_04515 [Novosphingobium pentaromativorans US6-1]EHJ59918.1 hypothetical protein NSU_3091 [Novosphingobium pentaromativorans US6-1]